MNQEQLEKVRTGRGFIAALDQSGGSTPKALKLYGVEEAEYSGEDEMFDRIHEMRTRIITSPSFTGERVLGAILFEQTMDREVEGTPTGDYLWSVKGVVPFLKVDKGLADEADGAQVMKPIGGLDDLLDPGGRQGHVRHEDALGHQGGRHRPASTAIVDQQFEVGDQILAEGLVPIIEPEVDIHSPEKAEAEALLKAAILAPLEGAARRPAGDAEAHACPSADGFYADLVAHPKVLRVVALSGGYRRDEANERLARNPGVIASFSRALTEGLSAQQSDEEFDATLDATIKGIFEASIT